MRLWRLARARHEPLDGDGARLWGGRWNSPGRPVVYTSRHASLAVLEKLVWVDPQDVPDDLRLFEIELPKDIKPRKLLAERLPAHWREVGCPECVAAGDEWLAAGATVALVVPSALLPEEQNVLLNPRHAAASRLRTVAARPFSFDPRLLGLLK